MRTATPLMLVTAAALALTACRHDGWGHHHADTAKITEEIKAQETQWQKDYADKNVDALAGHYASDAALGGPGDPLATTDAERRKSLQAMVSDPNMKITFASDRVQVAKSGDLAYSRGHYEMQMTDKATNQPTTGTGSYLTVWERQDNGSWKAVEDFITPGPAAAPAAK